MENKVTSMYEYPGSIQDTNEPVDMGTITIVSPLQEQKMQAEIDELKGRAALYSKGVDILTKYENFLDVTMEVMLAAMEERK